MCGFRQVAEVGIFVAGEIQEAVVFVFGMAMPLGSKAQSRSRACLLAWLHKETFALNFFRASPLWVAPTHQKHNRAGKRSGIVRQPALPISSNQAAPGQGSNVRSQCQRDHIGRKTIQHGAHLCARAAM